jgi:rSAM/selenodomain-associated transferase 1
MTPLRHTAVMALFVRQPIAGRVKTRLARDLGEEAACHLYRAMVTDSIAHAGASGLPLFLFHDGENAAGLPTSWVQAAERIFAQEGDTLGDRIAAAFEKSFTTGAGKVLLAGSDIPGIDAALLQSAVEALESHDAAFAPAFDGGYCLVATRSAGFDRIIFNGIPWSTSTVLETTLLACRAVGVSYRLLETRQDIDTMSDLAAYCRRPCPSAVATNAWLVEQGLMKSSGP